MELNHDFLCLDAEKIARHPRHYSAYRIGGKWMWVGLATLAAGVVMEPIVGVEDGISVLKAGALVCGSGALTVAAEHLKLGKK